MQYTLLGNDEHIMYMYNREFRSMYICMVIVDITNNHVTNNFNTVAVSQ